MTPLDLAVHRTFHDWPGGLKAAAAALGRTVQVMRNKACPTTPQNKLTLEEARDAMLMSGDHQILHALAEELGHSINPKTQPPASLMQELLREQAEHGDVGRAFAEMVADGRVTPAEVGRLRKEALEDIEALQRLVAAAQALCEAGGIVGSSL